MKPNISSTNALQPLTLDGVKSLMDKAYYLTYVDYRDDLDDHMNTIAKCMKEKSGDILREKIYSIYSDYEFTETIQISDKLRQTCIDAGHEATYVETFFDDNEEAIREEIYRRDKSDCLGELIDNTRDIPVMVKLHSNYYCIDSNWTESQSGYTYEEDYFGHMVDALNMNPSKVRKMLRSYGYKVRGLWPNKYSRNGNELVSETDFIIELFNSCCGGNQLIFLATISLKDLWEADFKIEKVTIPKGNFCGIFSSFNGGGSMLNMSLLRDITFELDKDPYDYFDLWLDQENYHSVHSVYGDHSFGENLKINA